jgi:RHS repeat-associated protein
MLYPNGLKQSYTNPEGITYTYFYTKHNELAAVLIPGEGQIGFGNFYWTAPQTLVLPGGSRVILSYDQFLQVKERLLNDPADTELAQALYEYDLENNITQINENYGLLSFTYDNLYRLNDADYPWSSSEVITLTSDESFGYDGVGNRISQGPGSAAGLDQTAQTAQTTTFTVDNQNRLTSSSDGATFSYNTNGHTTQKVHNGVTTDYIYNREERLIEVRTNGTTVGQYSYNPYGQRVRKIANGQTTWFMYNREGLAAEYDNSGNLIKEYHFKPNSPWMTNPLMQRTASGEVYYYQNDHLGTPQRMVSKNGAVVWEARYEAFGKAAVVTASVENNLRFPGQYADSESGLYYNFMRDYDPSTGRYLQSDPIGMMGGINTYGYVGGNPLSYVDPLGLARFGFRPLGGDEPYCNSHNTPDGSSNHHRAHE